MTRPIFVKIHNACLALPSTDRDKKLVIQSLAHFFYQSLPNFCDKQSLYYQSKGEGKSTFGQIAKKDISKNSLLALQIEEFVKF
jgi:hypothetical protein